MYQLALENVTPSHSITQSECWELLNASQTLEKLAPDSQQLLKKILLKGQGIHKRHFAVEHWEKLFTDDAQALNQRFEKEAPKLGTEALQKALHSAALKANEIDALIVCTCTGYLCPGLSSHIAEQLRLRPNIQLIDLVGQGCGAAIPMLQLASQLTTAHPEKNVACLAVEICSAAFYIDNDPGVLISLCLFGDGASASLWSGKSTNPQCPKIRCHSFSSLHRPKHRQLLRFENVAGKLRNRLDVAVPQLAGKTVRELYEQNGLNGAHRILTHPGGSLVLAAIQKELKLHDLPESKRVLHQFGNMSSPSILFALSEHLRQSQPTRHLWLTSFGAGFTCHSCHIDIEI
ncbi:MAG: stilbene synthase [Verrucomicrobiae bacterium]|nr:stilbene synthase [Verrucomicrobiae bacterium]